MLTRTTLLLFSTCLVPSNLEADELARSLTFYTSFASETADMAKGSRQLFSAPSLERKEVTSGLPEHVAIVDGGRWGKCLRFRDVSKQVVFFRGEENVPYHDSTFSMTVSFWLRVDPEKGLKPGYVDPLQITDKKWNDASLFVDFTKDDQPRHFRLGVFSDYQHWNPTDTPWDDILAENRPMVVERKTPFGGNRWTHVAFTLAKVNSSQPGDACLYLDGKRVGCLQRGFQLTWNPDNVAVMLGIQYIGDMDDFAIFNRALTSTEVLKLFSRKDDLRSLAAETGTR